MLYGLKRAVLFKVTPKVSPARRPEKHGIGLFYPCHRLNLFAVYPRVLPSACSSSSYSPVHKYGFQFNRKDLACTRRHSLKNLLAWFLVFFLQQMVSDVIIGVIEFLLDVLFQLNPMRSCSALVTAPETSDLQSPVYYSPHFLFRQNRGFYMSEEHILASVMCQQH